MTTISDIPPELKVEFDSVAYQGKGEQIYQCADGKWLLQAPLANLSDDEGNLAAEHFSGPTWQAADGSTVVGRVIFSTASPDATAIPWLLLEAVSNTGLGCFSRVRYIQRLNTKGGKAPSGPCEGSEVLKVRYSALYVFYSLKKPG
jgi:Protein of unknown function (DUF3455)